MLTFFSELDNFYPEDFARVCCEDEDMDDHDLNSAGMLFEDDDDTEVSKNYHRLDIWVGGQEGPVPPFSTNAHS